MLATLLAWLCKVGFHFVGRAVASAAKIMPRLRRRCAHVRSEGPAINSRSVQAPKRERKRRKHQRVDEAPRFSKCRLMPCSCARFGARDGAQAREHGRQALRCSGAVSNGSSVALTIRLGAATDAMITGGRVSETAKASGAVPRSTMCARPRVTRRSLKRAAS